MNERRGPLRTVGRTDPLTLGKDMAANASGTDRLTATGRFNHYASTYLAPVARFYGRLHARLYRLFGGTRFTTLSGAPVFELTVAGRKSGEPRPVMLMLVRDGADFLVYGSNGGHPGTPNWWKNLAAAGTAQVRVGRETHTVTLRVVTDEDEYEKRWRALLEVYPHAAAYRALSSRQFPIGVLSPQ
ncbi:nitroreductase/quinone reductase family protein [Nocardia sp. NPDC088792]|uniref:nitroreductase/quinone reductase family protein n=1 Tax=Nocardia sp. NPDC088792 TaxID=3364332 RepID=UPI003806DA7F